ncbi:class I SAM-dependent methyltransferase [uncultured Thiohalocapsa sp.]|uniref:class I SAM-dependent methyltransferase n=1 Tax=uncultured Thiohalocapsa sp. TaxID=768990 RepID=UPI0025D28188|nr:class I SAM-dependent methyltransferase [uncultured Thiohalocapsa sp.]
MLHKLWIPRPLSRAWRGRPGPARRPLAPAALLGSLLLAAAAAPALADSAPHYETKAPSRDGIGKVYMGREISQVMGHRGARWLERPSRIREELPERVVAAMDLAADAEVADIGAGTGYFAFRLAEQVPAGRVFAVDIQPEMLAIMRERMEERGVENVDLVLGREDDPELPPNSIDAALLVDAYHEFAYPREMMQAIVAALRPGGRVFLVEYRGEDPRIPIKPLHKMTEAQARREMAAVGLTHVQTKGFLPSQHFMVFEKPAAAAGR